MTREEAKKILYSLPGLPKPVTKEYLEEASKAGLLLKKDLVDGAYYYGHCRNAEVAKWDAANNVFIYIRTKFGSRFPEDIYHPEDDDGFDLFTPVAQVEPTEEEKVK